MYRARVKMLVLVIKGWACLCFDLSSAETNFWRLGEVLGRAVETSPSLSTEKCRTLLNKNTHRMYSGGCDAAIAKASAAVTHVQSPSQEVGSGDEGLGLLCFDLSSTETDF